MFLTERWQIGYYRGLKAFLPAAIAAPSFEFGWEPCKRTLRTFPNTMMTFIDIAALFVKKLTVKGLFVIKFHTFINFSAICLVRCQGLSLVTLVSASILVADV